LLKEDERIDRAWQTQQTQYAQLLCAASNLFGRRCIFIALKEEPMSALGMWSLRLGLMIGISCSSNTGGRRKKRYPVLGAKCASKQWSL
jgi:hypothetical protein